MKDGERHWEGGRKGSESREAGLERVAGKDGVRWRNGWGSRKTGLGPQKRRDEEGNAGGRDRCKFIELQYDEEGKRVCDDR